MAIRAITNDWTKSVIRSNDILENAFVQDCAKLGYSVHEQQYAYSGKIVLRSSLMCGEEAYALKSLLEEVGHKVELSPPIFNGEKWSVVLLNK